MGWQMGWRDVAASVMAEGATPAPATAPAVENFGLPDDMANAPRRLERLPPPWKLERGANWRGVVVAAMTIARDRWAAKAMALGWTAGELFGIGPPRRLGPSGARRLAGWAARRHAG